MFEYSGSAYSVHKANELIVVMGQLLLTTYPYAMSRRVKTVIVHEQYRNGFNYDVAVLQLTDPVPSNHALVKPIPLNELARIPFNTTCQVTGWGTIRYVR